MELKGSKTEKNLREAFAGESQARNKYTYFASVAKKEGYEQIAEIFLKTAENEKEFRQFIADKGMESYVILYGKKHGKELDDIFNMCDFGVGSLGRHRVGIQKIKTLKNREYAARGIPFVYSETDSDFDERPYVLKAPADETPVDISSIINFYRRLTLTPQEIRNSIDNLSWFHQMNCIVNNLQLNK